MDRRIYDQKKVSGEEAIRKIRSGQRVVAGHCSAEPSYLLKLMAENKELYENVEIVQLLPLGAMPLVGEGMERHFRYNSIFVGGAVRDAVSEGRADYTPCFLHQVPKLFKTTMPVDVALIEVTKPDKDGYCSFGVGVDYIKAAAENAKTVIAQVNENMPRTLGDSFIHISEIDYMVEHTAPLPEVKMQAPGNVEQRIGEYCASLIDDGDTLQLGIGMIPDAVTNALGEKRNLGIHSELISDGVLNLIEKGVVTNSEKKWNRGRTVTSFLLGTKRLFDFAHENPSIEMHPVDYVNDPRVIMSHQNFVSVNSCIQIDLMGQVVAETVGDRQISGVGGLVDFVRGASMSENGRSIIAMASTALGGDVSKIVPCIDAGAAVTLSRNEVDYVVTEYGIAALKGRSLSERAKALIRIAHPDFRDTLQDEWRKKYHLEV